jgi:hypothetical protein
MSWQQYEKADGTAIRTIRMKFIQFEKARLLQYTPEQ